VSVLSYPDVLMLMTVCVYYILYVVFFFGLYYSQLLHQRSFLREERRLIRVSTDQLDASKDNIKNMSKDDWLDPNIIKVNNPDETKNRVQLNVGGMVSIY
jgi:hypothetical protein